MGHTLKTCTGVPFRLGYTHQFRVQPILVKPIMYCV